MIKRNIELLLLQAMADTPVVLINGARQTGKTTMVRALAKSRGARYFTLDNATTLSAAVQDPIGFLRELPGPVVIDEIQKAPDLFPAIKLVVDEQRDPGRFLLTGSANVLTLPHLSESLAGRMEIIPLYPFSAGELAGKQDDFVHALFERRMDSRASGESLEALAERMVRGGYPEAQQRNTAERRDAWFASYISTILQRDVRDLARVDALHALPNLLKLVAVRSSGLLSMADLARDGGMAHTTLTRYFALLETVFLVHRLPAWSVNLGKRLVKAPKTHLVDIGLACHLLGVDKTRLLADRMLLGRLLESFVVGELRKQLSWTRGRITMHHYRTSAGAEVDVILERADGMTCAVEIKASATVGTADAASLRSLRDQLGNRFCAGAILYPGREIIPLGDRIHAIPVSHLWQ